ncbi:helix-turn-helix domain-containing protein [Clostridium pasteurianum]|uniref:Putative transcriptional regulator n=1 Tax=Clostridium pasteurianum BC1 TaxID=86416 RepID=R4K6P2_CLOPA|nr:helix-turn-helix transcriptional regulator [Clostridium pasteurianum]AGK97366.1 putative transcriptional regulator [Clostridium pasteurianum BC1]
MATFQERMKEIRTEKDITLEDLAKALNTTKSTLSRYENNLRVPNVDFINQLAKYFNVSVDYLLGNTDNPNIKNSESKLTKKDEKDIQKALSKTLEQLESSQDGLMFDGEPMDETTREMLRISIENSMRIAKEAAKKYTPKKYRK